MQYDSRVQILPFFACSTEFVIKYYLVRFQVLTATSMKFRIVFWDVLPCKIIVDRRFRDTCCPNDGDNTYLWNAGPHQRDYTALIPQDSKLHTSLRENLKSHKVQIVFSVHSFYTFRRNKQEKLKKQLKYVQRSVDTTYLALPRVF
jgi:hypothetical protein